MSELKILFRKLNIKNREGLEKTITFSILKVSLSGPDTKVILSSLTSGFNIPIDSYEILSYTNEVPSTLYTELPLLLIEENSQFRLIAN